MIKKLRFLALLLLWLPGLVYAQWNDAWPTRAKITVNAAGLAATVDQAIVAVRLHSGNFSFIDAKADGSDLRFVAEDDKAELKFHIEKFDSINAIGQVLSSITTLFLRQNILFIINFWRSTSICRIG